MGKNGRRYRDRRRNETVTQRKSMVGFDLTATSTKSTVTLRGGFDSTVNWWRSVVVGDWSWVGGERWREIMF